ncbi:kinase-like domain-containing protein [Mycena floridula]|nr:kinase-like domain-containing protein [Mycena floridula]
MAQSLSAWGAVQVLDGKIKQSHQFPFGFGGTSNLFHGTLVTHNRNHPVALKMLRVFEASEQDTLRRLNRECAIWSQLTHKNVLPFLGLCYDIAPTSIPVLVSPFCELGDVSRYLHDYPHADRHSIILGVALGLEYLHSKDIVHGDLKVANVLVDSSNMEPCICDFGISKIIGMRGFTTLTPGTPRYMAPELFYVLDGSESSSTTSKSSDVYAFGLLVLEILIAPEPLKPRPKRVNITIPVRDALRPQRSDYNSPRITTELWNVLEQCWADQSERPSMQELAVELTRIFNVESDEHLQPVLNGAHLDSPVPSIQIMPPTEETGAPKEVYPSLPVNQASLELLIPVSDVTLEKG